MKFTQLTSFSLALLGATGAVADTCNFGNSKRLDNDQTIVGADVAAALIVVITVSRDYRVKRDFSCTSSELCVSLTGIPFCYNTGTADFHTEVGITGNSHSGAYKLPDGRQGNMYFGPYPHISGLGPLTTVSSTGSASSSAAATASGSVTTTATTTVSAVVTSSAASSAVSSAPSTAPPASSSSFVSVTDGVGHTLISSPPQSSGAVQTTGPAAAAQTTTTTRSNSAAGLAVSSAGLAIVLVAAMGLVL